MPTEFCCLQSCIKQDKVSAIHTVFKRVSEQCDGHSKTTLLKWVPVFILRILFIQRECVVGMSELS